MNAYPWIVHIVGWCVLVIAASAIGWAAADMYGKDPRARYRRCVRLRRVIPKRIDEAILHESLEPGCFVWFFGIPIVALLITLGWFLVTCETSQP